MQDDRLPDLDASGGGGLHARVADALRLAIVRGAYPPGAALSEVALAEELRVSRTPVREALKQLATEGLVRIVPRVGTFVTEPSPREIGELFELRELFEGLAARLVAQRGDEEANAALRANVEDSARAVAAGDLDAYAALVHAFHALLVEHADNTKLALTYRWHMNQLAYHRLVLAALREPGRAERSVAEHRLVVERVAARDPFGAETAMRDHVRASWRALSAALVRQDRADAAGGAA